MTYVKTQTREDTIRRAGQNATAVIGGTMLNLRLLLEQKPSTVKDWDLIISDLENSLAAARAAQGVCAELDT